MAKWPEWIRREIRASAARSAADFLHHGPLGEPVHSSGGSHFFTCVKLWAKTGEATMGTDGSTTLQRCRTSAGHPRRIALSGAAGEPLGIEKEHPSFLAAQQPLRLELAQ